ASTAAGITSVIERGASLEGYRTYEALKAANRLRVRATVTVRIPPADGPTGVERFIGSLPMRFGDGDDWLFGDEIARLADAPVRRFDFVLEGGAIDHDGAGTVLTTGQTLLNANRNGWTKAEAEAALAEALGAKKVIWIDEGLHNDHTDGHIDNLARFVAPWLVVCQAPAGADDPNADILDAIARALECQTDANGRGLEIVRIPGAGLYRNAIGELGPASHMNFIIGNGVVAVPVYGTPTQDAALGALRELFPDRHVIGIDSRGLLGFGTAGGGSFHCITQQEPIR
ncbi:MAG: hypothetical protein HC850_09850, partial [Rhodomicrobium sp.]|nr:hypothetical protein [Rhodomicrobium sp.]